MCHYVESTAEWEALVRTARESRREDEAESGAERRRERAEAPSPPADD